MRAVHFRFIKLTLILHFSIGFLGINPSFLSADELQENVLNLETVTVTAEKREEDVQKVTTSTSVLSGITLEDAGIRSTIELRGQIPNFKTVQTGSRNFANSIEIRGISNTAIGDPGVALYMDDISYTDIFGFNMPLYDIKRVEVLKGPQGTLYGKNTEGGVINIVTKEPTNEWKSSVKLEGGDYNHQELNVLVNGPLIKDRLFIRLSGLKSSHDGYIKNVYKNEQIDDQETTSVRLSLIYKPSAEWNINFIAGMSEYDDEGGYPMVPVDKEKYEAATGISGLNDFESANDYRGESSLKNGMQSLRLKYQGSTFDIISITGQRYTDNTGTTDGDYTPSDLYVGVLEWESSAFSQEVRIQSKDDNPSLKWLLGLYYSDEKTETDMGYKLGSIYAAYYGVPAGTAEKFAATMTSVNSAVFGQTTVRVMDNKLGFSAGLRLEDAQRGLDDRTHTFGGVNTVDPINDESKSYSVALPKAAVDYRLDEDKMVYFSVAKGYKAGGFSYAVDDPDLAEFDPEISTAMELGFKSEFPDNGVRLNVAVFSTKVDDYQDRVQIDDTNVIQSNVTEVNIYGFETELTVRLTDSLTLNSMLGYTKAIYGDYVDPISGENYEGNAVVLTPEYNAGIFFDYRAGSGLFSRLELQNTGKFYFDRGNETEEEPYSIANVKLGYEARNWDLYLSVKNITNEQYFLGGWEDETLGFMGTVGDPRTIQIACNYRF